MTERLRTYHFQTKDQWDSSLFSRADRGHKNKEAIRPQTSYVLSKRFESGGARLPFVTTAGEILWLDGGGDLHCVAPCDDLSSRSLSPIVFKRASRIVTTSAGIWVLHTRNSGSLELYESETFTKLLTVDLKDIRPVDLASDGSGSIFILTSDRAECLAIGFDRAGHRTRQIQLPGISDPLAFAFLRDSQRFVCLTGGLQPKLEWFSIKKDLSKTERQVAVSMFGSIVAGLHPCFKASAFGSDTRGLVFLGGQEANSSSEYVITLDADGEIIGEIQVDLSDSPITGLCGDRNDLLATGKRGLLRFRRSKTVLTGSALGESRVITPVLFSPDRADNRRWLRAEVSAYLPEGTRLDISYAAVDSTEDRERLLAIFNDTSITESTRISRLLSDQSLWTVNTVFHGAASPTEDPRKFSAPLFDEKKRYLLVCLSLTAVAGASLPSISSLDVYYPGATLMQNLPAIYQKNEPSFLRSFVGVLEATTQEIDERIATMGSLITPSTAPEPWLDFVARWLGVPWDNDLNPEQKRRILDRASEIADNRGTRAGLEILLECLIPGRPPKFRVIDPIADFGFAVVGGGPLSACASELPAILGGKNSLDGELDFTAVLGAFRLRSSEEVNDGAFTFSTVRVDVAATAAERKSWEPWLLALITNVVPVTTRIRLSWVAESSLRSNRLDGNLMLERSTSTYLDTDAITDHARLPDRPIRLEKGDPIIGRQLR